jgi:hypothetical protein
MIGPELVRGTVNGVRRFNVSSADRLYSPYQTYGWRTGLNTARCTHHARVAPPQCTCGFYSNWAGHQEAPGYGDVLGVVECSGWVVAGPEGMRAQHARVVALASPERVWRRWMRRFWQVWGALCAALLLVDATQGWWAAAGVLAVSVAACGVFWWGVRPDRRLRRVADHYGVRLYPTVKAMLKAHPCPKPYDPGQGLGEVVPQPLALRLLHNRPGVGERLPVPPGQVDVAGQQWRT